MSKHFERHNDGEIIVRFGPVRFWKQPKHVLHTPAPSNGWVGWELHVGRLEVNWHRAMK